MRWGERKVKKQLEYSEFSFGYAFTENLIRSSATGPSTAPRFPNLVEEGGLGYDVKIDDGGVPLFFQYKLPERMVRASAAEISRHRLGVQGLPIPFFRMYLTRRESSRQHELLVELERKYADSVFYAAPFIVGRRAFDDAYAQASVHLESALFSPMEIGNLPPQGQHVVAYHPELDVGWLCSEPTRIDTHRVGMVNERRVRALKEGPRRQRVADVAREVTENVLSLRSGELDGVSASVRDRVRERRARGAADAPQTEEAEFAAEELSVARELARVGLGVEFVLAQSRD